MSAAPASQSALPAALKNGFAHHRAGRLAEAEACYRQVLQHAPEDPEALHHLGLVRHQSGQSESGVALIRRAIVLAPGRARYQFNLAKVLTALGREREAAIAEASAWLHARKPGRAEPLARRLAEAAPDDARSQLLLAESLNALGRTEAAEAAYSRVCALSPDWVEPWLALAGLALQRKDYDTALERLEHAEAINPSLPRIHAERGQIHVEQALHDEAVRSYRQALAADPSNHRVHSALVYCRHYMDEAQPGELRRDHEAWATAHTPNVPRYRAWRNDPDPERTLRVGIVSPDFRAHPDGQFLLGLLQNHDARKMHITCYSEVAQPDFFTRMLYRHADQWVRIHGWSDAAIAERLRDDAIDIVLDPTGHQHGNRLMMYARKAVPLQVAKIGYVCTRGLPEFDAILTDPLMTPPETQRDYVERLQTLPSGHFVYYPPPRFDVPVVPPPVLESGRITFGSFNNSAKLVPRCIALFAGVLAAVPESTLYLRAPHLADRGNRERLCEAFARHGIARERLRFGEGTDKVAYLQDFNTIDVHLDSVPNNGVTTTCDSLWMGVPVVALVGTDGRSRAAAALVTRAGHPEWAASDADAFVRIAKELAGAPDKLAGIRRGLRSELETSPICDGSGHAAAFEAALRDLWRGWCAARVSSAGQAKMVSPLEPPASGAGDQARPHVLEAQHHLTRARHSDAVESYRRALDAQPELANVHSALLYCRHYMDEPEAGFLRTGHEIWAQRFTALVPRYVHWGNTPNPARRIRVGVISPELRAHPAGRLLLNLMRHHDREALHITCYSETGRPDIVTRDLQDDADGWADVHGWSEEALAERIRADEIDILLERTGHQEGNRLRVYARRPAPVQVALIGYQSTRGLPEISHILSDPLQITPHHQRDYVEQVYPVEPGYALCYPPPRFDVPVASTPAIQNGHVTFGSFNNASKITPRCLALWNRVLEAVPESRLYVRAGALDTAGNREAFADLFRSHGFDTERVRFGPASDMAAYLADFAQIDIHLDTMPNNGVLTTCDSLWMGVPVLTLWGTDGRSRAGATLVTRAGHSEWAADDEDAYVRIAAELASNVETLAELRHGLRAEFESSPICDGPGHARAMEKALRDLWGEWCSTQGDASAAPPR